MRRYFVGSSMVRGMSPVSGRREDDGEGHEVRLFGPWPQNRVRRIRESGRTAVILGECFGTRTELCTTLASGEPLHVVAARTASFPGSFSVVVSQGPEVAVATDLAGLHRVWFRQTPGVVEYASSPLPLTEVLTERLDSEALAAGLFCGDFHTGLPGGSLFKGVTEVAPDQILVIRRGVVKLVSRHTEPQRLTVPTAGRILREALDTGVRKRVVGARAVTADLSGGMDSSSLALLAARHRYERVPALTYSDPFAVNDDDTGYAARLAAQEPRLAQVVIEGGGETLPFTDMDAVPWTDHPSLDTVIFARDRARLLPASASSVHLAGDGGDVVLGAPLTYLATLARTGGPRRFLREARGWARLRHRPAHRVMRAAWRAGRTTYADTLAILAACLEGDAPHRAPGRSQQIERGIAWARLSQCAAWGTPKSRGAVAGRLRQAVRDVNVLEGVEAHTLRTIRQHTFDTRLFVSIAEHIGVEVALPFFDNQVVAACLSVPAVDRVSVIQTKPLLKAALSEVVPSELYARRTKGDYGACEYHGVRRNATELRALLRESRLGDLGIIRPHLVLAELERAIGGEHAAMAGINQVIAAEVWLRKLEHLPAPASLSGRASVLEGYRR
ncbi:albusnodin/ikarugamycin family macrolactam cyclase [Nocardiopsis dassonvillei]